MIKNKALAEQQNSPERIKETRIVAEMERSYLDYAVSVIVSRALPDIRDGLKPVQRRIIYAMYDQGIGAKGRYQKSAAVVGEVLKKYHPHGDSSVYGALVRMAQDFSLRYPLIDGQGNFGSLDGDSAAAMRYTECRLTPIAEELLLDIKKETVPFVDNYSASAQEPQVLPGMLPNILLNGASGIAVGMATNMPPHNLSEVIGALCFMIDSIKIKKLATDDEETVSFEIDSDATVEDLMKHIKGPDFPTGAEIYDKEEITRAYATGKGRVVTRARAEISELKNGKHAIIITEIPYQQNKARLVAHIAKLAREGLVKDITALRDESDRDGLRIVVETKKGSRPKKILNQLYHHSSLQTAFNVNTVGLIAKEPKVMTLKMILEEILKWRKVVVIRRTQYLLRKAREREHILLGLKIALDHLDAVITTIRKSKNAEVAKANLVKRFDLSEIQAQAILDMQLRRLARLERQKIEDELAITIKEITGYLELLAAPTKIMVQIKNEFLGLAKKYGDARRTTVHPGRVGELEEEDLTQEKKILITLTGDGYVKRVAPETFKAQKRGGKGVLGMKTKENDTILEIKSASTIDEVLFFTERGKVHKVRGWEIPEGTRTSRGKAIVNILEISTEEKIRAFVPLNKTDSDKFLVFATEKGIVKRTALSDFQNVRRGGITAIKTREGDRLIQVGTTSGHDTVILITTQGKAIRFAETDLRAMGRATSGVRGIRLGKEDRVVAMSVIKKGDTTSRGEELLTISQKGYGKRTKLEDYPTQKRGGRGVITQKVTAKTGSVVVSRVIKPQNQALLLSSAEGQVIRINPQEISSLGRATKGVRIMRLKAQDQLAALACLE